MNKSNLQLFSYDNGAYCDFTSSAAKAVAGKDILLAYLMRTVQNYLP